MCFDDIHGSWMNEGLCRKIGEGNETEFWNDSWLGTDIIKVKYPRLFSISIQQNLNIKEMGHWRNGTWQWEFRWRRNIFNREESLVEELRQQVDSVTLSEGVADKWIWSKEEGGIYSVKSAYVCLLGELGDLADGVFQKLWSVRAPSNAISLAWKLLHNRIQSKVNLRRRGLLNIGAEVSCSLCSLAEETTAHLFFTCAISWKIWVRIYAWLGIQTVLPEEGRLHFLQSRAGCYGRDRRQGVSIIWLAAIGFIWHFRNKVIFRGYHIDVSSALEVIQYRSWIWLKSKTKGFTFSLYEWTVNPLWCLGTL